MAEFLQHVLTYASRQTVSLSISHSLEHIHSSTNTHTNAYKRSFTHSLTHSLTPGIDSDEVELHRVHARGQVERLVYVGSRTLQTVTAAYCAKIAARGDPTAAPTV